MENILISGRMIATDRLLESAAKRTIINLIVIPTICASISIEYALFGVFYIALVSFLHVRRCSLNPTRENLYRKDFFFNIISSIVISVFGLFIFIALLTLLSNWSY